MIKKSPLNYSGSKDKIVKDIIKYIPEDTKTFVDAFGGAFNVGINVDTEKVVYNELNKYVYDIIKMLLEEDEENLIKKIEDTVLKHNLKARNKEAYINFRNYYNNVEKTPLNLYVLSLYSFSNYIRFSKTEKMNMPVGKQEYNKTIVERIHNFKPYAKEVELYNLNYKDIELDNLNSEDTLFYFDPPYIVTTAVYNEKGNHTDGWSEQDEKDLLSYIENLDKKGYKFILSNIIKQDDKENNLLVDFINRNNYDLINIRKFRKREEIIVKNF